MKKIILLCALLSNLGLLWLGCGGDNPVSRRTDHYVEEPFLYTVDVQDQSRFRLVNITGTIEITGQSGVETITIAGVRRVGASSVSEAEAHLEDLQVELLETDVEVFVRTSLLGDPEGRNYVVDYTITLPPHLEVRMSNQTGTVTVENMQNNITGSLLIGGVILEGIDGDVEIDVTTGQVSLEEVSGDVDVDLTTGDLNCRAFLPPEGVIDLKTITGNMTMWIPEGTSAQFSASVSAGTLKISNLPLQNQSITNNLVTGQLGDGNGTITLQLVTGQLTVSGCVD